MAAAPPAPGPRRISSYQDYVQALATILVIVAAFPFIIGGDCSPTQGERLNSEYYSSVLRQQREAQAKKLQIEAKESPPGNAAGARVASVAPGARVGRSVFLTAAVFPAGTLVDLEWTPPPGASGVQFVPAPANPAGPPPFLFEDLPLQAAGSPAASLVLSYDAPAGAAAGGLTSVVDTLVTTAADGSSYAGTFKEDFGGGVPAARAATAPGPPASESVPADARAAALATPKFWAADVWLDSDGTEMTTALCQQLVDFLQSGKAFVASRFPVPPSADPRWAALPLVARPEPGYSPHLDLERWSPSGTVVALPSALAPERTSFAENDLPGAPGERWMTFSPRSTPRVMCPEGLSITGGYSFRAWVPLDLTGLPDSCAECELPSYLCYEGQEPPLSASQIALRALGLGSLADSFAGSGVTCMGPLVVRLINPVAPNPPFEVEGMNVGTVSPPATIEASHALFNLGSGARTITLSATSTLGLDCRFYRDLSGKPNLAQPITAPVVLSAGRLAFWAVADVPVGVQGTETLTITASSASPAGSTSVTDLYWVGDWQPPPVEVTPQVDLSSERVYVGDPVTASGTLPNGAYRLAIVPNATYVGGECYAGVPSASTDIEIADGVLPPTTVWASAEAGRHDLLVLGDACTTAAAAPDAQGFGSTLADGRTIVTGDDLSSAPGFTSGPPLRRRLRAP